jgi:hypothetical protein
MKVKGKNQHKPMIYCWKTKRKKVHFTFLVSFAQLTFSILEAVQNTTTDEQTIYKFHFETSDQLIQLNQSCLNRIPYLQALVTHRDDFSSIQNKQDEFVYAYRIERP